MSVKQRCRYCKEYVDDLGKHDCWGKENQNDGSIAGRTAQIGAIRNSGFNQAKYPHGMNPEQWRNELAARVMQGIFAGVGRDLDTLEALEGFAIISYMAADAMLKEGDRNESR